MAGVKEEGVRVGMPRDGIGWEWGGKGFPEVQFNGRLCPLDIGGITLYTLIFVE